MGLPVCKSLLANLLLIVFLKLINQFTTFQYLQIDTNAYEMVNQNCQLKNSSFKASTVNQIGKTGYLLAAAGGLLANKYLSFRLVLMIGGAVMTLATGLQTIGVCFGAICNYALYIFIWTLHPVYMCLVIPCLYFGFIRLATGPRSLTALVVAYYLTAACTVWLNMYVWGVLEYDKYRKSHIYLTVSGLAFSTIFVVTSGVLDNKQMSHDSLDSSQSLTVKRLLRYVIILTSFTLYICQLGDGHLVQYKAEILQYFNTTSPLMSEQPLLAIREFTNLPRIINQIGVLIASGILVSASAVRCFPVLSCELRIQAGVALASAVALFSLIANLCINSLQSPSPVLTTAVFCSASFLDGVSEIVTMVSVYEFIDAISLRAYQLLLIGVMFSVWSLANVFRIGLDMLVFQAILHDAADARTRILANHIVGFLTLVICFLYTRFISIPLSYTLMENQRENSESERLPLLDRNQREGYEYSDSCECPMQELRCCTGVHNSRESLVI